VKEISQKFEAHWLNDYRSPTHFTLKYMFDEEYLEQVETVLEKFAAEHTPTPVKVSGCNYFARNCFYMDVHLSDEAKVNHERLLDVLKEVKGLDFKKEEDLHYHASLALFDVEKRFDDIWKFLQVMQFSYDVQFDNIALLGQGEQGWVIQRLFTLG
jgi:2'-5' RNA ligase